MTGKSEKRGPILKRMIIMLICVCLVFGGVFGYKAFVSHMIEKAMSNRQAPAVTVSTTKATMQAWQPELRAVGTVRAMEGVDVTTEIAGLVRSIFFQSGTDVKKGQVLVQLNADADTALLHSLQAEAELARTTFQRDKQQFAIKAISKAVLDVSEADLKSKQAQVEQQAAVVNKKTIRAPFSGRIGISMVDPGQYLNPGAEIATLQSIDTIYVDFLLPQQNIDRIALGQTVTAAVDSQPGRRFEGKITAVNPKVDPQTRNIRIQSTFANTDHALLPGMFMSVTVQAGAVEYYITLPQTAVTFNPYGETVYIIEPGGEETPGKTGKIAKQVFVTTGGTRGDQIAVLEGIKAGDTVVTGGQLKLQSGARVTVNNEIQPSNEASPRPPDE